MFDEAKAIFWLILLRFRKKDPSQIRQITGNFMPGGLEQVVLELSREAGNRGLNSKILVWNEVSNLFKDSLENGEIKSLSGQRAKFYRHLYVNRVSVIHFHYFTNSQRALQLAGLKTVYTIHNLYTWLDFESGKSHYKRMAKFDHVVAVSKAVAKYAEQRLKLYVSKPPELIVIPNGISVEGLSNKFSFDHDANKKIVMLANFHRVKHYLHLAGVIQALGDSDLTFHIYGDFEGNLDFKLLREKLENLGALSRVVFYGVRSNREVRSEITSGKYGVFLSLSLQEGCSISLAEVLAAGLPVVTTETGNSLDLAKYSSSIITLPNAYENVFSLTPNFLNELGLQTTCANTKSITQAITKISENFDDFSKVAQANRERFSKENSVKTMVDRYLELYRNRA